VTKTLRLTLLLLPLLAVSAAADTITTKDGQTVRGEVVAEGDESVTVRTKYGEMTIPKADVKRHERATYAVTLKDGTRLEGKIVGRTAETLSLRVGEETHEVPAAGVESVAEKAEKKEEKKPRARKLNPQQRMVLHRNSLAALQKKDYAAAVAGYEKLLASDPNDRIALYNVACAHALSGEKPEALKYLKKSVEAGFVDFQHVERDPDLEGLREEPAYKDLFERRGEYTRKAAEATVERITASLARRGIKAKAYRTFFDKERNFVYLHQKPEEEFALVRKGLEEYAGYQWKSLFQNKPGEPLYIVLLTAKDSPRIFPRRGGGFFQPAANTLFCGDIPATKLLRTNVIVHEFTHALHFADQRVRRQRHPIWLIEGLATLFESSDRGPDKAVPRHSQRLAVVQAAVRAKRSFPWKTLMKLSHRQFMANAGLAYAQSRYMLFYIHEKGLLKRFYDEYTKEGGYAGDATALEAFEVVFGKPIDAVERDWKVWVLEQVVPSIPYLGVRTREKGGRLVVEEVVAGSPADAAGVKAGDAIEAIDGAPIKDTSDLLEAIGSQEVGEEMEVAVERGGEAVALKATLVKRPSGRKAPRPPGRSAAYLGLTVEMKEGAVSIREVDADSPAAKAGLEAGAIVLELDGGKIDSVRAYLAALRKAKPGGKLKLKVRTGEEERELEIELAEMPRE